MRAERRGLLYHPVGESERRSCRVRVVHGILTEPYPGLFARAAYWNRVKPWVRPYQLVRSLATAHPERVFTSFSAACIYGLPVSMELLDKIHVAKPKGSHTGGDGSVVRHAVGTDGRRRVMGVLVTPFDQTVVDCLRMAPFPDALAIADGALRIGDRSRVQLADAVERSGRHCPGIDNARRAARYADARAESGGESVARGVMIEEGFAVPICRRCFRTYSIRIIRFASTGPGGRMTAGWSRLRWTARRSTVHSQTVTEGVPCAR